MATHLELDRFPDSTKLAFNCQNCGSRAWVDAWAELDSRHDCPRCRSEYAVISNSGSVLVLELATVQNEYTPSRPGVKRMKPIRDAIYSDPVLGPIRRAQDRLRAAERDLARAMASAHESGKSIREVAQVSGYKKSRTHELIRAVKVAKVEPLPPIPVLPTDEVVF